jgi:hypothetical protein
MVIFSDIYLFASFHCSRRKSRKDEVVPFHVSFMTQSSRGWVVLYALDRDRVPRVTLREDHPFGRPVLRRRAVEATQLDSLTTVGLAVPKRHTERHVFHSVPIGVHLELVQRLGAKRSG